MPSVFKTAMPYVMIFLIVLWFIWNYAIHKRSIAAQRCACRIGPPKKDRKQSIKNKNNRSPSFHFDFLGLSVCGFVVLWLCPFFCFFWIFGCSLISHELLDKTYIYAHHQNELNEGIKVMYFICRFSVYFSLNQRKCSQNGEDGNIEI